VILRPVEPKVKVKQIALDDCEEELCIKLREGGKYVDELVILPDKSVIVVEHAKWPTAYEGAQALSSFRKLIELEVEVAAIVIVGKKGFDKRDKGLIAQALRSVSSNHRIPLFLVRPKQHIKVKSIELVVTN